MEEKKGLRRIEGVMEFSAEVTDEEVAQLRIQHLAEVCRNMMVKMEQDGLLPNMSMDFTAFILAEQPIDDLLIHDDTDVMSIPNSIYDDMCRLYNTHRQTVDTDLYRTNDYMRGMFNGMEVLMSVLEGRDAKFMSENGQFVEPLQLRIEGGKNDG